jgi:hypothetical protein
MTSATSIPPPAPPWTGTSDAWLEWVRRASAGELRSLVAWGQKAMAADAPIGFPVIVEAPPPAPLTPEARRKLDELRAQRTALSRQQAEMQSAQRSGMKIRNARRAEIGPDETGALLRAQRIGLGLSEMAAAKAAGVWRGQVSNIELERRPEVRVRRKLLALYRSLQVAQ